MSTPEGPRADAQVTVLDPFEAEIHDYYNGKTSWDFLSDTARTSVEDDARFQSDFAAGLVDEHDEPVRQHDADEASI